MDMDHVLGSCTPKYFLYISDLHFDHWGKSRILEAMKQKLSYIQQPPIALVIAGDLMCGTTKEISEVLLEIKSWIDYPIIFVCGNHEYYGQNFREENDKRNLVSRMLDTQDIHWLESSYVQLEGVTFVGGAGWIDGSWYDIHNLEAFGKYPDLQLLNDFRYITHYDETKILGQCCRNFIRQTVKEAESPVVAITHTMPIPSLIHPMYAGQDLNFAFANNWIDLFDGQIHSWICGHSHCGSVEKTYNETRICMNPIGYPGENLKAKDLEDGLCFSACVI